MSFAKDFVFTKPPVTLPDGDYQVQLAKPYFTTVGGYNVLRFPFTVVGMTERTVPDYFDVFECAENATPQQKRAFNYRLSAIKACFMLIGQFDESNFIKWAGSVGTVTIQKNEKGFMNVTHFLENESFNSETAKLL